MNNMCGINGIVQFDRETQKDEIEKMNQRLKHRGPDGQGVFLDSGIGLGHTRLKIIDLSEKGAQPMEKDQAVITYNGEIYNFKFLRELLRSKGYKFDSETDTEVVLASYLEYGIDCLQKLNGMFSFVIYDKEKQILFGARDRFGQKPLKYYLDEERFVFSSEMKAILNCGVKKEVDYEAISDFLTLQYVPSPKTGFKNIWKLPAGHYFIFNLKTKKLEIKRYFDLDYSQKQNLSKEEWKKQIKEKLESAVRKRLVSDVPLGAFLSGGIDSSAIVAMMSKQTTKPIKTFSIVFGEKDYDESRYARKAAELYRTDHTEFKVQPNDLFQYIDKLVGQYDEPFADVSALPTYLLSKLTKEHVTVALSGDGGDENFGGYDKYRIHLAVLKCGWVFKILKKMGDWIVNLEIPAFAGMTEGRMKKLGVLLKTLEVDIEQRHYNFTNYFDEWSKERVFGLRLPRREYPPRNDNTPAQRGRRETSHDIIDQVFHLDFNSYLPDCINTKVDIASMANSLEVRAPFLDYELAELAAQMPYELKLDCRQGKKILKEVLQEYLPPEILYRKKKGFSVPLEHWFRNELKEYMQSAILDKDGLVLKIGKEAEIKRLIEEHFEKKNNAKKLWALLVLNIWYKKYV